MVCCGWDSALSRRIRGEETVRGCQSEACLVAASSLKMGFKMGGWDVLSRLAVS